MAAFDIPPKPKLSNQIIASVLVLIVVAVVVAILTKLVIGFIIFLLGAIAAVGSQVAKGNSLDK